MGNQTEPAKQPDAQQLALAKSKRSEIRAATTLTQSGAVDFASLEQMTEFAKLMAESDVAVPEHLRGNIGACLAVVIQAREWEMSPFSVANKSYKVKDRLAYEAQLINAVILQRAPIKGRFKVSYSGDGPKRRCKVVATLNDGETVEYESPEIGRIPVQNSPLWKGDPDQQLYYYSSRAMCRRHFPDVILGVYSMDEIRDQQVRDVTPPKPTALPPVPSVSQPKGKTIEAEEVDPMDREPEPRQESKPEQRPEDVNEVREIPTGTASEDEPLWTDLLPDEWRNVKMPEGGFRAGHTVEVIAQEPEDLGKALQNNPELTGDHGRALACAVYVKLIRFMGSNEFEEEVAIEALQKADESFSYNSLRDVPTRLVPLVNSRIREIIKAAKGKKAAAKK